MPIGVPRIIYCWGEELPAQWTDIYNFIFRRRMVFLMQYLDDELCNQICGLLINIHMEDRSKELERKEMSNSGLFSNSQKNFSSKKPNISDSPNNSLKNQYRSVEDLMISEEDLRIDESHYLNNQTLQKISLEWLNWNSQFFDYSDEPYLFYLAELLAQDVTNSEQASNMFHFSNNKSFSNTEFTKFLKLLKIFSNNSKEIKNLSVDPLNVYSPFRLLSNFVGNSVNSLNGLELNQETKNRFAQKLQQLQKSKNFSNFTNLKNKLSEKNFFDETISNSSLKNQYNQVLTQRQLRNDYTKEKNLEASSYLNSESNFLAYKDYYKKQTERSVQEDESKKVFMVINSFGGSVGNGITVHDALQFIKAGSMTLALGVAASAASLALAGGTIGERYVTEGCHVMIHQPEGGLSGQASDIWIDSLEIMKIRLDVAEIYSLSTYRPKHKILRDLDRDFYLTATEAIYYGLADEIATNDVMHSIIEMTSKVWDYHDTQQQKLLESRESATAGLDTQTQN
uniref:ATP-dependent Clp protease proteolytic subunit n=1 Tax=Neochloris aquatica TaxID=3099 RepID=A0A140H9M3_9CHLO|nr:proteolytic subunit 2 of clp protease [Neochloris aquatica]AMO00872.1 proteolytic subunit 2 of clp protease [Neochloris aquatica]